MISLAVLHEIPGIYASICADDAGCFRIVSQEVLASFPDIACLRVIRAPAGTRRYRIPVSRPQSRAEIIDGHGIDPDYYIDIDILRYVFRQGDKLWAFAAGYGYDRSVPVWVVAGGLGTSP